MQITANHGSIDNYNTIKNLFTKHSNISNEDFDTFYENYQSEPLQKKQFNDLLSNHNIIPVRNFVYDITPEELLQNHSFNDNFNFISKHTLSGTQNAVSFVPGDTFDLGDESYLEVTSGAVLAKCKNEGYDSNRMKDASDLAGALNAFIRFANGQTGSMFFDAVQQNRMAPFLSKLGIDLSQSFTVNNVAFDYANGNIQKQSEAVAYGQPTFTDQLTQALVARAIDKYVTHFGYE